jgi:hypothetical protein
VHVLPIREVARVSAYYSISPEDPQVHHNHDDCEDGKRILPQNRRDGTNGYRLCEVCEKKG